MNRVLVTGAAGFIGSHLCSRLCKDGVEVLGVDNLNPYYSTKLKHDRLGRLERLSGFTFAKADLADRDACRAVFLGESFDSVVHLAAQPGVRHSIDNPDVYTEANLVGVANVLEGCRHHAPQHLVFASSSSVYGANQSVPFRVEDRVDHPVSLYAATKKAGELLAHSYSHLYDIPTTCLRFFTVYGPWGRPDMAVYKFVEAMLAGRPIDVYCEGRLRRDFTYVDDVVEGLCRLLGKPPERVSAGGASAPYRVYNIGNNQPVVVNELIATIEQALGVAAKRNELPAQPGDVPATYADVDDLMRDTGFRPSTPLADGIREFVAWYRDYHDVPN